MGYQLWLVNMIWTHTDLIINFVNPVGRLTSNDLRKDHDWDCEHVGDDIQDHRIESEQLQQWSDNGEVTEWHIDDLIDHMDEVATELHEPNDELLEALYEGAHHSSNNIHDFLCGSALTIGKQL